MFNITLDTTLVNTINMFATILAPLIIVGLWGFGLGCITKAFLVVVLRLAAVCSEDEVEVMSLDQALWHAAMAELPDFDPSEFEPAKKVKTTTIAIVEEEEEDIILATFGAEDLTKWEPKDMTREGYVAKIALQAMLDDHYDFGDIEMAFWPVVK